MDALSAEDLASMQATVAVLRTVQAHVTRNTSGTDTWTTISTALFRFVPLGQPPGLLDTNAPTPTPRWRIYGPPGIDVQVADRIVLTGGAAIRQWNVMNPNLRVGVEVERAIDAEELL